jgi:hypothetical protein
MHVVHMATECSCAETGKELGTLRKHSYSNSQTRRAEVRGGGVVWRIASSRTCLCHASWGMLRMSRRRSCSTGQYTTTRFFSSTAVHSLRISCPNKRTTPWRGNVCKKHKRANVHMSKSSHLLGGADVHWRDSPQQGNGHPKPTNPASLIQILRAAVKT